MAAIATQQVVRLVYQATAAEPPTTREIEPIGLYLTQHWHVVAYCRLRQDFRNFRLDRVQQLALSAEQFAPRPETLQQYWANQARYRQKERVVLRFQPAGVLPSLVQRLHDTKRQCGWAHEQPLPDGGLEMTFFSGTLAYLAAWLLPYAGAVAVLEPPALRTELSEQARRAHDFFCAPGLAADTGLS